MVAKLCLAFLMLMGGVMDTGIRSDFNSIPEIFPQASQIIVYREGVPTTYDRGEENYVRILAGLAEISQGSYDMPAFGVSLDPETRVARESGLWVELVFDEVKYFNDYPFESLLIAVRPTDAGFNLARQMDGKYEGRNLYLSLAGDMQALYDVLQTLITLD